MTAEAEARAALAAFDGIGGLERWIAEQRPWEAATGGWTVPGELQGWRFRLAPVAGGVDRAGQVSAGVEGVAGLPGPAEGDMSGNAQILLAMAIGALATQLPAIVERLLAGPG